MTRILSIIEEEPKHVRALRAAGFEVDLFPQDPSDTSPIVPPELARNAEILFCNHPPANLSEMKSLQVIQLASVGTTQLDGLKLRTRGIRIANARGAFDVPIAEWNIAMMIHLLRDIPGLFRNQQSATWDRNPRFQKELRGSTVGLWGYGGIGRETARLGKALGLRIHALTRTAILPDRSDVFRVPGTGDPDARFPDRFFTPDKTIEFLSGLDFLILAMPLTAENTGIVGETELAALPDHSFLLNPARGPLVEESALLEALQEGQIAGAALDTHYHYPMPPEHPLWQMANVVMTPHISGSSGSPHFLDRTWEMLSQNARRYLEGTDLLNETTVVD